MAKKTYYVREGFVLHKKSFVNAKLATQLYEASSAIDLEDHEAIAYAHLIETKEQKDSRKTTKGAK